jgi:ornithine carbamoyltransferase
MKDLITLADWTSETIREVLHLALDIKRRRAAYREEMAGRTLVMLFEKPSLRTRVSFETGMSQMGGHAIHYDLGGSPLGAGKETVADTARVLSRYVDAIMARLFSHAAMDELARHATVPVINGLTDDAHPTQILADLLTIQEKKGALEGLTLAYLGDGRNNVTHSLLIGCARVGLHIRIGCPADPAFNPAPDVLDAARGAAEASGATITVVHDASAAVADADVVYTDSWMSYHVDPATAEARIGTLRPFQVDAARMAEAKPDALFMNCLPAQRGMEQTAEVLDGPKSVVFDEAENRLHAHKAILVMLLRAAGRSGDAPR